MKPGDRVRLRAELPTIEPWPEGCVRRRQAEQFVAADREDGAPDVATVLHVDECRALVVFDSVVGEQEVGGGLSPEPHMWCHRLPLACLEVVPEPGIVWFVRTEFDGIEEHDTEAEALACLDREIDAATDACRHEGRWDDTVESIAMFRGIPARRCRLVSRIEVEEHDEGEADVEREVYDLRVEVCDE